MAKKITKETEEAVKETAESVVEEKTTKLEETKIKPVKENKIVCYPPII